MAFIGKNVIENLTTAMYENLLIVYREYIQNAADSIDKAISQGIIRSQDANIDVSIDNEKRVIEIEDNGIGIRQADFQRVMSSIADSTKDSSANKGFRGIGRLGGISSCAELCFSCSFPGEPVMSCVSWNAERIKEVLNDHTQNPDAASLVDEVTTYTTETCAEDIHFFKVEMINVDQSAQDILNIDAVKQYLSEVAPLPYAKGFTFSEIIKKFAIENNFTIDEYNVFVNGERLYKGYTSKLYEPHNNSKQGKGYDEIQDVKFEIFRSNSGEVLCWMWYGISRFEKQIPSINKMRAIRLRKGNIQIGDASTFSTPPHNFFKEERGYLYFIGEVFAIHKDLRPNARRDYFNLNDCCREFEKSLYELFHDRFYTLYHQANEVKNAYKRKQDLANAQEEYHKKEQYGFDSQEDKDELEKKIEDLSVKAKEADRKINTRKTKAACDDVMQSIIAAIEKERSIEQSSNESDDSPKTEPPADKTSNPYKNKPKFKSQHLTKYSKKDQKLIGRIYGIIKMILPNDTAELVINKIQEELSK